jgi:hypothetical protein
MPLRQQQKNKSSQTIYLPFIVWVLPDQFATARQRHSDHLSSTDKIQKWHGRVLRPRPVGAVHVQRRDRTETGCGPDTCTDAITQIFALCIPPPEPSWNRDRSCLRSLSLMWPLTDTNTGGWSSPVRCGRVLLMLLIS